MWRSSPWPGDGSRPGFRPVGSPKRERGEYGCQSARLPATHTVATRIPIARAPGFLGAKAAVRRFPGSPKRERGEYARHSVRLHATHTVAARIPIARAPGFLGANRGPGLAYRLLPPPEKEPIEITANRAGT